MATSTWAPNSFLSDVRHRNLSESASDKDTPDHLEWWRVEGVRYWDLAGVDGHDRVKGLCK